MGKHYSKKIRRYRIPEKKAILELSLRELKREMENRWIKDSTRGYKTLYNKVFSFLLHKSAKTTRNENNIFQRKEKS